MKEGAQANLLGTGLGQGRAFADIFTQGFFFNVNNPWFVAQDQPIR